MEIGQLGDKDEECMWKIRSDTGDLTMSTWMSIAPPVIQRSHIYSKCLS